jgi:hypothetical protein
MRKRRLKVVDIEAMLYTHIIFTLKFLTEWNCVQTDVNKCEIKKRKEIKKTVLTGRSPSTR